MALSKLNCKQKLIYKISQSIKNKHISHAYILEADKTVDKLKFAKEMVKAILCPEKPGDGCDQCLWCKKIENGNMEDLYVIEKDGNSVKDEIVSPLQEKLLKKPMGPINVAIICDADTMTVKAQNRILKTLEEPKGDSIIFLLCENRENLLQTIRSRCITYSIENDDNTSVIDDEVDSLIDMLVLKESFFQIKGKFQSIAKNKEESLLLLDQLQIGFRNMLVGKDRRARQVKKENIISWIYLIEEARIDININVNYKYAMKNLLLKIGG